MIKRIVDISEPAYLHSQHSQLCIDKNRQTIAQIPIEGLRSIDTTASGDRADASRIDTMPAQQCRRRILR